jgi:hypothetical protein
VDALGIKQDPFGQSGLARVDMGADADVANFFDVVRHDGVPCLPDENMPDWNWKQTKKSLLKHQKG